MKLKIKIVLEYLDGANFRLWCLFFESVTILKKIFFDFRFMVSF